jgi:HEAT repeat protein
MSDPSVREPAGLPSKPSPDRGYEALPNVTPPNASFILQLFLIPMVIVSIIVALWMGFSWLAHMGTNPEELVTDVEKLNDGSWQRALTLADLLRNPQYDHLKDDEQLAQRLAAVLQRQLAAGDLDKALAKHPVNLRLYLSRVLGEFRTPVVLPALVEASVTERDAEVERTTDPRKWFPKEIDVRRAAIESLAVLAGEESLGPEALRRDEMVMSAVLAASREPTTAPDPNDDRAKLRQTAAYTLGVIGGDAACERLAVMLGDAFPNTRYNAAIGLARNGDLRAVEGLVEMLDPENRAAVASETSEGEQTWKRGLVMMNALRAAKQLEQKNPQADLAPLHEAVARLLQPKYAEQVHPEVLEAAREMTRDTRTEA